MPEVVPSMQERLDSYARIMSETVQSRSGQRDWTSAIISAWRSIGERHHLDVRPGPSAGEYMRLDLCWWAANDLTGEEWIQLALESELGRDEEDIHHDFWKLISIKAPDKVFIYSRECGINRALPEELAEQVRRNRYFVEGEQYWLLGHAPTTKGVEHVRVDHIDTFGNLTHKRFLEIRHGDRLTA